ncbi:uncharacterized protein L203_101933 [Cryptococcus depauperatus CBS 7841]|uniref:Uncharacterized protein n=1 Tax=Cryptococcus depauperatus CBS 7841 TaxID=1295531 RepID=A0A1E3IH96_9TREE|nr:hypothetical protein L203_03178 [Cryptococcus depauperatus CBS 7841]
MSGNGGRSSTWPRSSPSLERQSSAASGRSPPASPTSHRNRWGWLKTSNYKNAKCGEPPEFAGTASQQSSKHTQERQLKSVGRISTDLATFTEEGGEEIGKAERLQDIHPLLRGKKPTTKASSVTNQP